MQTPPLLKELTQQYNYDKKKYRVERNIKIALGGLPSSFSYQMRHEL